MLRCCHRHVQVLTCSQVMKTGEKCLKNMSYHEYKSNRRIERERRRGHHEEKSIILSAPDKTLLLVVTFLVIIGFLANRIMHQQTLNHPISQPTSMNHEQQYTT